MNENVRKMLHAAFIAARRTYDQINQAMKEEELDHKRVTTLMEENRVLRDELNARKHELSDKEFIERYNQIMARIEIVDQILAKYR